MANNEQAAPEQAVELLENGKVQVVLSKPLARSEGKPIAKVTLSEPTFAQLQNYAMSDLDKIAVLPDLIPRIAEPELFKTDFEAMKMSDLLRFNAALTAFI